MRPQPPSGPGNSWPVTRTVSRTMSRTWRMRVLAAATACRRASNTPAVVGNATLRAASTPTSAKSSTAVRSGTARRSTRCWCAPPAKCATPAARWTFPSSTSGWNCAANSSTMTSDDLPSVRDDGCIAPEEKDIWAA